MSGDRDRGDDGDNGGASECGGDGNGGQTYIIFVHSDRTAYTYPQVYGYMS